jgi:hypothetical protein
VCALGVSPGSGVILGPPYSGRALASRELFQKPSAALAGEPAPGSAEQPPATIIAATAPSKRLFIRPGQILTQLPFRRSRPAGRSAFAAP